MQLAPLGTGMVIDEPVRRWTAIRPAPSTMYKVWSSRVRIAWVGELSVPIGAASTDVSACIVAVSTRVTSVGRLGDHIARKPDDG
jgi:hypothetical protein